MTQEKFQKLVPTNIREAVGTLLGSVGVDIAVLFDDPPESPDEKITVITKKRAAEIAGVSIATITRRMKEGCFAVKKINSKSNGTVRIFYSSFMAWLQEAKND